MPLITNYFYSQQVGSSFPVSSKGITLFPVLHECHRGKDGILEENVRGIVFHCLPEEQVDFEEVPLACGLTALDVVKTAEWNSAYSDSFGSESA